MGQIDVLLPMIDGAYSLSQYDIIDVIDQIKPQLIIPIHYFGPSQLQNFLNRMQNRFPVEHSEDPHIVLSRSTLPKKPEILVMPAMQEEFFRFAPPSRRKAGGWLRFTHLETVPAWALYPKPPPRSDEVAR